MTDSGITDDEAVATFGSVSTANFANILAELDGSLLVTTYQAGRLVLVRSVDDQVNTHFSMFEKPMGLAHTGGRLALGTRSQVWTFANAPDLAPELTPRVSAGLEDPVVADACFVPRTVRWTGDIQVHDAAWVRGEPWVVATRFSCLASLDDEYSFVPRWKPRFITAITPEDRCHLNGVAVRDGRPTHVTALGATDVQGGWREGKADGGVLIDVQRNKVVLDGLCMPHSPRWHNGRLWFLESGMGVLSLADLKNGSADRVSQLPGFTRGLAFAGQYGFVGLSKVRESSTFGGLPITEAARERECGVWAIDLESGATAGFLRFSGGVEEIYDVAFLSGIRYPEFVDPDDELLYGTFFVG